MESVAEKTMKELYYFGTVDILRQAYLRHLVETEILERINEKNAEYFGCRPVDFKELY